MTSHRDVRTFRSIWLSDAHLGSHRCQVDALLDVLRRTESATLYLVGDIVDGWRLARKWYWPNSYNDLLHELLFKVRSGTRVVYVAGNHDRFLRRFIDLRIGNVEIVKTAIHETATGRRLLVTHGDEFDAIIQYAPWLPVLGERIHSFALMVGRRIAAMRRGTGRPGRAGSPSLIRRIGGALTDIDRFRKLVAQAAIRHDAQGVVCGHNHRAELQQIDDVVYCNAGDWVDSCTLLAEDTDGTLLLIDWVSGRTLSSWPATSKAIEFPGPRPQMVARKPTENNVEAVAAHRGALHTRRSALSDAPSASGIVGFVQARAGSERIPLKNLRLIGGRPLVSYGVRVLQDTPGIDGVFINTESQEIADVACRYGAEWYRRSPELASSDARTDDWVADFLSRIPCEIVVVVNPCVIFLKPQTVSRAIRMVMNDEYDSVIAGTPIRTHVLSQGRPMNFDSLQRLPRTQDLTVSHALSFGVAVWRRRTFLENYRKHGTAVLSGRVGVVETHDLESLDIDTEADLELANAMAGTELPLVARHFLNVTPDLTDLRLANAVASPRG